MAASALLAEFRGHVAALETTPILTCRGLVELLNIHLKIAELRGRPVPDTVKGKNL